MPHSMAGPYGRRLSNLAESAGRAADSGFEQFYEARDAFEPEGQGNVAEVLPVAQKPLRPVQPSPRQELVRCLMEGLTVETMEMIRREGGHLGQIGQTDPLIEIRNRVIPRKTQPAQAPPRGR